MSEKHCLEAIDIALDAARKKRYNTLQSESPWYEPWNEVLCFLGTNASTKFTLRWEPSAPIAGVGQAQRMHPKATALLAKPTGTVTEVTLHVHYDLRPQYPLCALRRASEDPYRSNDKNLTKWRITDEKREKTKQPDSVIIIWCWVVDSNGTEIQCTRLTALTVENKRLKDFYRLSDDEADKRALKTIEETLTRQMPYQAKYAFNSDPSLDFIHSIGAAADRWRLFRYHRIGFNDPFPCRIDRDSALTDEDVYEGVVIERMDLLDRQVRRMRGEDSLDKDLKGVMDTIVLPAILEVLKERVLEKLGAGEWSRNEDWKLQDITER
ncbi:hypothetical protein GLOTRDRAFT_134572 [Gloeophyllum trabeum ATCC 11539]|uniref:Uncharacterized protein n=1 Tax=Gloeophyllum trabeum (strain ATCC 11539 / FP-39264 / Madison 617) TaxID=670483 RepID=S7PPM6_GLOTA|nr:uncharacterized protein GLOTRDRAFT_134572 [Gloeophyllum trabeum ATCC 11539]EPQ49821.1 hypothetical protein GLOTRDRAFT_134572 [Gloeophyllum trabeum ATCC 11539]